MCCYKQKIVEAVEYEKYLSLQSFNSLYKFKKV